MEKNINGFTIRDIPALEEEAVNCKKKRSTFIIVGVTLGVVSLIAVFVLLGIMFHITDMIEARGTITKEEYDEFVRNIEMIVLGMILLGIAASAGEALAVAGGVTNHIKYKKRVNLVRQLKAFDQDKE